MADWKDILSENDEQLSEEDLLKYLDSNISEEEKSEIEKKINNHSFESDAMQGLLQIQNKDNVEKHVTQLNQKLKQLTTKKSRKEKRQINIFKWIFVVILFILFTCIICYIIVNLLNKSQLHSQIIGLSEQAFIYL